MRDITQDTLAGMRAAAQMRERNRETAKLSLLNVRFGVEALAAHLDARVLLHAAPTMPDKHTTLVRERWRLAIIKVLVSTTVVL